MGLQELEFRLPLFRGLELFNRLLLELFRDGFDEETVVRLNMLLYEI